jgi:nucleotide-binding universal stress UspA family protein
VLSSRIFVIGYSYIPFTLQGAKLVRASIPEQTKVLIAYDGSSYADAALDDIRHAGLPRVAEALILSVADVFLPPPSSPEPAAPTQISVAVQRVRARATRAVEEAHALALQAQTWMLSSFPDWDVHAEACADSPPWAVIKKAVTWQPDLVVVGSHGRSATGRLLLGSVSHKTSPRPIARCGWDAVAARPLEPPYVCLLASTARPMRKPRCAP